MTDPQILEALRERLTFFFSDANLRHDTFLNEIMLAEKKVSAETLLKFSTIAKHTKDKAVVLEAAKGIDTLAVEDEFVSRVDPFTEAKFKENLPVTLYLSHVPNNGKKYSVTLDEVRGLFEQYGKVAIVKFRFRKSKHRNVPCGSAYVEFVDAAGQQAAAADCLTKVKGEYVTPKREIKLKDEVVHIKTLEDQLAKVAEKEAERKKKKREFKLEWNPGCALRIEGLSSDGTREAMLEACAQALGIDLTELKQRRIFTDYERGQQTGFLQFKDAEETKTVSTKLSSGDVKVSGAAVGSTRILEGEEEEEYWEDYIGRRNTPTNKKQKQEKESEPKPEEAKAEGEDKTEEKKTEA